MRRFNRVLALTVAVVLLLSVSVGPVLAAPGGNGRGNAYGLTKHLDKVKKPKKDHVTPPGDVTPPDDGTGGTVEPPIVPGEDVALHADCPLCLLRLSFMSYSASVGRVDDVSTTLHFSGGQHAAYSVKCNADPTAPIAGYAWNDPLHRIVYAYENTVVSVGGVDHPMAGASSLLADPARTWTVEYRVNVATGGWVVSRFTAR